MAAFDSRPSLCPQQDRPLTGSCATGTTAARTLDRKIARIDKRIEAVGKVRVKAAVAHELGVAAVVRPVAPANPTQLVRAVDNQLMQLLGGFAPARRQQAMEAVVSRDRGRGMGR
jgi:hypothetical protein